MEHQEGKEFICLAALHQPGVRLQQADGTILSRTGGAEMLGNDTLGIGIDVQESTQGKKQNIDHNQQGTHPVHILFGIVQVSATQILLHHILIEPCHYYANKHAAEEVLEKIITGSPIPNENLGIAA